MRLLHVSQPVDAGVAGCVLNDVRDQVARGWSVSVACPDGKLARDVSQAGARVLGWAATRSPGVAVPNETARLSSLIGKERPDLLHLHSSKAALAGRLAVRGRLPTVVQPHAWSFESLSRPLRDAAAQWERIASRWSDVLLCCSNAERRRAAEVHIAGEFAVVPNGVDLVAFPFGDASARQQARHDLGLPYDRPLVVCVGRVCRQKGQDLLLRAWPRVLAKASGAQLVLVGDGPATPALRSRSVPEVRFVGPTDHVQPWFAAADLVVSPSRYEGMALVPLEAMATGRSVVVSDIPPNVEVLGEGTGLAVPAADAGALAEAITLRLADRDLADAEGRKGRAHVEAIHDIDRVTDLVAALYAGVLAGNSAPAESLPPAVPPHRSRRAAPQPALSGRGGRR